MSDESEDRDRMIGNALSLILSASRGNHIVHDACLEVDAEIARLRAEVERLLRENLELQMQPVFDEYRP